MNNTAKTLLVVGVIVALLVVGYMLWKRYEEDKLHSLEESIMKELGLLKEATASAGKDLNDDRLLDISERLNVNSSSDDLDELAKRLKAIAKEYTDDLAIELRGMGDTLSDIADDVEEGARRAYEDAKAEVEKVEYYNYYASNGRPGRRWRRGWRRRLPYYWRYYNLYSLPSYRWYRPYYYYRPANYMYYV